jgi:cytochrome c-type biogenesis protein CcmE
LARFFFLFTGTAILAAGRLRVNNRNMEFTRRRAAAVTEEGSVQKTAGDHAVCFESRDAAQSIDVLVEVGGAPDDDHPDQQHETERKGCEHL